MRNIQKTSVYYNKAVAFAYISVCKPFQSMPPQKEKLKNILNYNENIILTDIIYFVRRVVSKQICKVVKNEAFISLTSLEVVRL